MTCRALQHPAPSPDFAPWHVVVTDDKRRGRLNLIHHLLSKVPYKDLPREKIVLPKRQKQGNYEEQSHEVKHIRTRF